MSKQLINIGSSPNDGTGDNLRNSFIKINNNFNEVYEFSGTTGGGGVTNVTYSGLTTLINNSGLTNGELYLITDYQTVHVIPNANQNSYSDGTLQIGIQYTIPTLTSGDDFSNVGYVADGVPFFATNTTPNVWDYGTDVYDYLYTGPIEPLLVTASSTNTLKPESYSSLWNQDVIYYDWNNNQDNVPGCTKGYIYRRIDTLQNNDIPFDFRNVKFRRWQIDVTNMWDSGTTYNKNNVVTTDNTIIYVCLSNNVINVNPSTDNENVWKIFEWNNLSYVSNSENNWNIGYINIPCTSEYVDYNMWSDWSYYDTSYSNIIEIPDLSETDLMNDSNNVIFGSYFSKNNIGSNFQSNSIGSNFQSNSIGSNFYYNSIGSNFYYNSIGSNFQSNSIGSNFQSNSIGINFYYNSIGSYFNYNTIGSYFNYNSIGSNSNNNLIGSYFGTNTIGSYFGTNTIGSYFGYNGGYNTIGSRFQSNTIGNYFQSNTIGNYFQSNTIESYFYDNSIGSYFYDNSIGSNFISNNSIGSNFTMNTIGSNFQNNSIGSNFQSNSIGSNFISNNSIGSNFTMNTIGSNFQNNSIGSNFQSNSIGSNFYNNSIGSNFTMNTICDGFSGIDFTSATYVYNNYSKELFIASDASKRLIYDKMTIVDANA